MPHPKYFFEKFDKNLIYKTKTRSLYTLTDFVECLIENIDYQDRRFVIKKVTNMKIIPINDFCVVLRHIQNDRKGVSLP